MMAVRSGKMPTRSVHLADLLMTDEQRLANVLKLIGLDRLNGTTSTNDVVEQTISIEVLLFQAALFALPASGIRAGSVIAVRLVPASNRAR